MSKLPRCKPRSRNSKCVKDNNFYGPPSPKCSKGAVLRRRVRGGVEIGKMTILMMMMMMMMMEMEMESKDTGQR